MTEELDPNKIAAEFMQQNIEKFVGTAKGIMKAAADQVRLHLDLTYKAYITTIFERHSKAKSFFIRTESINLYEFYVSLGLSTRDKKLDHPGIRDVVEVSPFSIITGSAGSGKSMIMRHLLINTLFTKDKVPVFIELRQFNQAGSNLRETIQQVLNANELHLDKEFVEKALKAGHFAIFLDGFDEINLSKRQEIGREILSFAEKYRKNWFIISSRHDNTLEGWPGFSMFEVSPLTLDQAQELIKKLPFDKELKPKFIDDLRKGLFAKHESFLSNPLLLSIMLLTYGQGAHIPNKLNVFYNQAYEALFQRHDALKGGFQRQRQTQLDIQDYAKAFSAFSVQTYDKTKLEFTRMEALAFIDTAKKITQLEFISEDYLNDAFQAVCLLVEDGLLIVFAHRSFQEYFTARFIAEAKPEMQKLLIEKYSKNVRTDSVMKLLYEMRPDVVEEYFILPEMARLKQAIQVKGKVGITHYTRYLKRQYKVFRLEENDIWGTPNHDCNFSGLISFTLFNCGHLVGWNGFKDSKIHLKHLWGKYGQGEKEFKIKQCCPVN